MRKRISDEEFIKAFKRLGSPHLVAEELGLKIRGVYERRNRLQDQYKIDLATTSDKAIIKPIEVYKNANQLRVSAELTNGTAIVFSDAHWWPGLVSVAHRALLKAIEGMRPKMVIANGDIFDGARISSHARIGWDRNPTVLEELHAVMDRTSEIEAVAKGARLIRTIGNHDVRFEKRLAGSAPEYEGVAGFALKDHLPTWQESWSLMLNENTMVKHRWHNGVHATYNNTLKAGRSIVTGHLHRLCVTPWGDYNGRRYGVDTGTLADPDGPQFFYGEDNPSPHCSGFAVLTFDKEGNLLPPELCEVINGVAYFRGVEIARESEGQE